MTMPLEGKINLHPITLSFKGDQAYLEKAYTLSVHENQKYMFEIRTVIFLAGLVYSLFGILDVLLVPDGYKPLLFIRFGIFLPYILFVILLSYTHYFQMFMQLIFVSTAVIGGGGIIAMIVLATPPATYSYYAGLIIVFMFLYTFGRVRFIWATLSGWLLILVYELTAIMMTSPPLPVVINNNFFFICANVIGMVSCYLLEFFDRRNFYMTIQLENEREKTHKTNEELEKRVYERTALLNNLNADLNAEIDQRKTIEDELRKMKDELEVRVENRTFELISANKDLGLAKERADESARSKSEFLANMSHEIRTPMNAIIGMSDLAMNSKISQEQRNEYLDIIRTSARSLLGIINDILDLSKIEAGKLELEAKPFRIREHVEGVTDMFIQTLHFKDIELIVDIAPDIPVFVRGDSLRLQQILLNLISNALKFTERGDICVILKKGRMDNTTIELLFEVTDTGIGIDLDEKQNLFDAFAQADGSITRKYGGTGLGLTICKRIVSMMGGEIRVDSKLGLGSRFYFNVIVEREREKNDTTMTSNNGGVAHRSHMDREYKQSDAFKGMRVLLVEDNLINQMVAVEILLLEGIHVTRANNGREAVDMVAANTFDAVLMDVQMPEMDGIEATGIIKNDMGLHDLPVIAMTAHVMQGDKERCLEAGMNDFISKPIERETLFKVLSTFYHGGEHGRMGTRNGQIAPRDVAEIRYDLPGLDMADGLRRLGCDMESYIDIITDFCQHLEINMGKVKEFANVGDLNGVMTEVHTIKGAAANISAHGLEAAAKQFDNLNDCEHPGLMTAYVNDLESAWCELMDAHSRLKK